MINASSAGPSSPLYPGSPVPAMVWMMPLVMFMVAPLSYRGLVVVLKSPDPPFIKGDCVLCKPSHEPRCPRTAFQTRTNPNGASTRPKYTGSSVSSIHPYHNAVSESTPTAVINSPNGNWTTLPFSPAHSKTASLIWPSTVDALSWVAETAESAPLHSGHRIDVEDVSSASSVHVCPLSQVR